MRSVRPRRVGAAGGAPSFLQRLFHGIGLRTALMMGLIITYLWRFQDLAPVLAPLRLAAILSAGAIVVLLFQPNWNVLGRALKRPYVVLFIVWTVWIGAVTPFALDPQDAWAFWWDYHLKNGLMFLFVLSTLSGLAALRLGVAAHLIGVSIVCFYYVKQGFPTDWTPLVGVDRNDLALMFNLATPLAVFYALTEKGRWARWGAWTLAGIVAMSTILTQSRGGFLTVAVVVVFLSFRIENIKLYRRFIPLTAFVLGIVFMPQDVRERLSTILETEQDYNRTEATGRVSIWTRGIGYMADHPAVGVGLNNFSLAESTLAEEARTVRWWRGHAAHNIFVQVGAETGVPGFLLFAAMIIATLISLNRTRGRMARMKVPWAWVLFGDLVTASVIAFCVGGFFLSWGYSPFLYFFMALTAGYQYCEPQLASLAVRQRPRPRKRRVRRPDRRRAGAPVVLGTE